MLAKFSKQGISSMWIENFQMYKLGLEKAEEPEIKLPAQRKQGNSRKNTHFCFIDYAKDFKRDGNTRPPSLSPENLYAGQEATGRTRPRNMDWSKIGKGV